MKEQERTKSCREEHPEFYEAVDILDENQNIMNFLCDAAVLTYMETPISDESATGMQQVFFILIERHKKAMDVIRKRGDL